MDLKFELLSCVDALEEGKLVAERLRELARAAGQVRQSLLYMQTTAPLRCKPRMIP